MPPSPWWARTSSTSRPRSEQVGSGHALGHGGGMLLCPLLLQDGHRHALGRRARPTPRPQGTRTAARQRLAVLGPEPDGTGGDGGPSVTGLQRPEGASDSALLRPSPGPGGQAGGCGQWPGGVRPAPPGARLSCCNTGPACLAWPAWHRFLDAPTPWEAASPLNPFRAWGPLPRPRQSPLTCAAPRGRTRSPLRDETAVGNLFFLSFSFLQ